MTNSKAFIEALRFLRNFMSGAQISAVIHGITGEEKQYFIDKAIELTTQIKAMPHTYQQSKLGNKAIAHLHYFRGNMDWWITEKDMGCKDDAPNEKGKQHQAFGVADIGHGMSGLGYTSIQELIENGVELDFHWTPKTIEEIKRLRK